jgi:hypothetical protein
MLFVTWQAPESRRIFPIARVLRRPSGEYEWAYVRAVAEARAHGFAGLPGYDDIDAVSVSRELPALFAHRVPARGRRRSASMAEPANDQFDPTPITLLVPLGPGTNERLEVFAPPLPAPLGKAWGVFVARGVGRIPGSESAIERLAPHDPLRLRPESNNPQNPRALLILRDVTPIGYVPDYLANELVEALAVGDRSARSDRHLRFEDAAGDSASPTPDAVAAALRVEVLSAERVNHAPASPIYSVLCRYTCSAELGARLFRSERYQPVAADADVPPPIAYR